MDNLNLILKLNQFRHTNVILSDCRPNRIMNGQLTKIMYSDECISLHNISFILPFVNTKLTNSSTKTFLSFSITNDINNKIANNVISIEDYILNYYIQMTECDKIKV